MLFIYAEREGKYGIGDTADGTIDWVTLEDISRARKAGLVVKGILTNSIELDWLKAEEAKYRLLGKNRSDFVSDYLKPLGLAYNSRYEKNWFWPGLVKWQPTQYKNLDLGATFSRYRDAECHRSAIEQLDTFYATDLSHFFQLSMIRGKLDLRKWDVRNVENFKCLFDSSDLIEIDLSTWDVSKAKNMSYMFCDCYNLRKVKVNATFVEKYYELTGQTEDFFEVVQGGI